MRVPQQLPGARLKKKSDNMLEVSDFKSLRGSWQPEPEESA